MKRIVCIVLVLSSLHGFSQSRQLFSFEELMKALKSGNSVSMVVHYPKCKLISDNEEKEKVPDAIGGMKLDTWEYFAVKAVKNEKAFVVFSESKIIQNPKGDGFVYNYVKVKVSDDNQVKLTAQYVNTKTFEIQMDENFFSSINDGKNDKAIFFYTKDGVY